MPPTHKEAIDELGRHLIIPIGEAVSNTVPAISNNNRSSLQDQRPELPGQHTGSQRSTCFSVTDDIDNASISAFARYSTLRGRSRFSTGNTALPTQKAVYPLGLPEQFDVDNGSPFSDCSVQVKGSTQKLSNSSSHVEAVVSTRVQVDILDHELSGAEQKWDRDRLVRKEVRGRAMEALQRCMDGEMEG
jgi:hypothetical protein